MEAKQIIAILICKAMAHLHRHLALLVQVALME
jgi:hypothetical protein